MRRLLLLRSLQLLLLLLLLHIWRRLSKRHLREGDLVVRVPWKRRHQITHTSSARIKRPRRWPWT